MALLGLFGEKKPTQKMIEKQITKIKERYSQSEYRKMAMEKLLEWNTKESIEAVLKRFEVVVQSPHWDEDEKRWLLAELIKKGDIAKNALIPFLGSSNEVTHAISVLDKLCKDKDELTTLLLAALAKRPPEDHRLIQGKKELVVALGECGSANTIETLLPYLDDHSDDIQCTVVDIFLEKNNPKTYPALAQVVSQNTRSARVLRHAAQVVHKLEIPIEDGIALAPVIGEDYVVSGNRLQFNRS